MRRFIIAVLISVSLMSCSSDISATPKPSMSYLDGDHNSYCHYLIDDRTGVVYLEYHRDGTYGITVMFNADGTIMTRGDLYGDTADS